MLLELGVDIYSVSKLLGHSDVRITEKVYAAPLRPVSGKRGIEARPSGPSLIRENLVELTGIEPVTS